MISQFLLRLNFYKNIKIAQYKFKYMLKLQFLRNTISNAHIHNQTLQILQMINFYIKDVYHLALPRLTILCWVLKKMLLKEHYIDQLNSDRIRLNGLNI